MKTRSLIKGLDAKEQKRLEAMLQAQKRTSLVKLYTCIKNHLSIEDIDKKQLYESFAKDKYTTAKDYLLRNELRLLNELIEQYILDLRLAKLYDLNSVQSQILLLEYYYDSQCYDQFEKDWKVLWKRVLEDANFDAIDKLTDMWVAFSEQARELNLQTFEELKQILLEHLDSSSRRKAESYSRTLYCLAYVERVFKRFDPAYQMVDHQPNEAVAELWAPSNLWRTMKASMYHSGQAKIDLLLQALEIFDQIKGQRGWLLARSRETLLAALGLEFFLIGDYAQATLYGHKAVTLQSAEKKLNISIIYNYCSALCARAQFHEALNLIGEHEAEIQKSPRLRIQFQFIKLIAWINTQQTDNALKQLSNEKPNNFEPEIYYHRLLIALCLFELNEIEQCQRELTNLLQVGRYKAPMDAAHTQTVKWLTEYTNILTSTKTPKDKKQKLLELQSDIGTPLPTTHRLFICQWLLRKIEASML
jgi:hypothetical protein